jgi:hypothetical protein
LSSIVTPFLCEDIATPCESDANPLLARRAYIEPGGDGQ